MIRNPEIDRGESAGVIGDFLGFGRKAQPKAAPEELYQWNGPGQSQIDQQRKEAMGQKAPQFSSGEAGVGGVHMGTASGVGAQQADQKDLGGYYKDVLEGRRESAGAAQLKAGGEQALAAQLAASRQVKGAGMGTARYQAAQQGAASQAQANQQAGIMRAQEQAQAAGAYGGLLNQQQMGNIAAYQAMQQSDQFRASEQMKQQALAAQMGMGYTGLGIQAGQSQLQGGIAQGQNFMTAQGLDASQRQSDAAQSNQMTGAAMSAAAMLMMSDIRAKGDIAPAGGNPNPALSRSSDEGFGGWTPPGTGGLSSGLLGRRPPTGGVAGITPGTLSQGAPGAYLQDPARLGSLGLPGPNGNPSLPAALTSGRARASRALPGEATPPAFSGPPSGVGSAPPPRQMNMPMMQMMSDPLTKMDIAPAGGQSSAALESQIAQGGMQGGVVPGGMSGDSTSIGKSMLQGYQAGKSATDRAAAAKAAAATPAPAAAPPVGVTPSIAPPPPAFGPPPLAAPPIMSDRRIKDVEIPGGHTLADDFLEALTRSASTYSYKDPSDEPTDQPTGGKYLGIMAQELEKTPTGDTLVKDGPKGKYLEMGPNLSAALAGLGRLNERLDSVEEALGAKSKTKKKGGSK